MAALSWRSSPRSSKAALLAVSGVSLTLLITKMYLRSLNPELLLLDILVPYLQLIPSYAIFYPWVFVTAIFAETTPIGFLFSLMMLSLSAGYVEKFWGYKEVMKFVLVIGTITNFSTVIVVIISNIFRGDIESMNHPLGGGISYYFLFLIVIKQLIPEHNVALFRGALNVRVKHLPFTMLVFVILLSMFMRTLYPAVPSMISFLVSYNYLRFFQSYASDPALPTTANDPSPVNFKGDASDAFQLVEFFPAALKPFLGPIIDSIYDVSVLLAIVTPFNDETIEQSNIRALKLTEQALKANKQMANSVAERRRQVALQAIEDRINQSNQD